MTENTAIVPAREQPELTPFEVIERIISAGDLGRMTPDERVAFYFWTCDSLGLNPITRPFEYLVLDGKIVLYARKDATEQLRRINDVSITELRREKDDDLGLYTVYASGRDRHGRMDEATGVVSIKGLSGMALANSIMKAETKAKRRLTLSLCGLGILDESEVEGMGDRVDVDLKTGEITPAAKPTLLEAVQQQAERLSQPDPGITPASIDRAEFGLDDPEEVTEIVEFMATPMTEAESAAIVEDPEDEDEQPASPARTAEATSSEPKGLSIKELSDLSKAAGIKKGDFAKLLDVIPADVGSGIEKMTDGQRYDLAVDLGLVPGDN
jgi:hypothetical protein